MRRRELLTFASAAAVVPLRAASAQPAPPAGRSASAPSGRTERANREPTGPRSLRTGRVLPPIGLGTWLTFDVATDDADALNARREVLRRFFAAGGGLVDSSPMYGRAEQVLGELLPSVPQDGRLISETKVWTPFDTLGPVQIGRSLQRWGVPRFDVLLVHNLLNWRAHLKTLRQARDAGRTALIGVSTSHGNHAELVAQVLRSEPIDVLQITYNLADDRAEPLLELAAERGVTTVINRPFDGGQLFGRVNGRPLPAWAGELDCISWAALFLKWVIAHPAVGCAIPATRDPDHLDQNMAAGRGRLPDAAQRRRIHTLVNGF